MWTCSPLLAFLLALLILVRLDCLHNPPEQIITKIVIVVVVVVVVIVPHQGIREASSYYSSWNSCNYSCSSQAMPCSSQAVPGLVGPPRQFVKKIRAGVQKGIKIDQAWIISKPTWK